MEQIYTIKVKRKFDPRDQYPSERRYSASTVFGFAWVHLALAFTCFLLACLALYNPLSNGQNVVVNFPKPQHQSEPQEKILSEVQNETIEVTTIESNVLNEDEYEDTKDSINNNAENTSSNYTPALIIAPCLIALGAFVSGFAAIVASRKWYVDQSITWFFLSSVLSTILSLISVCIIVMWIVETNESGMSFCDYFSEGNLFDKVHIESGAPSNEEETLYYVIKVPLEELRSRKIPLLGEETKESKTRKVLSINILIAACIELIWSLLSLKIGWNGMRSDYPDDDALNNRGSNGTVHVITELKGNNTKHLPKNTKILPPQPDLVDPKSNKIKKFFKSQQENGGFFLRTNQNNNGLTVIGGTNDKFSDFSQKESSAEYKERMMNFLNKCASGGDLEAPESCIGVDPGSLPPSEIENTLSDDESKNVNVRSVNDNSIKLSNRLSNLSWGDIHDRPVYDQNTLDLEKVLSDILNAAKSKRLENEDDSPSEITVCGMTFNLDEIPNDKLSVIEKARANGSLSNLSRYSLDSISSHKSEDKPESGK